MSSHSSVGLSQTTGLSSLNYDELDDDTLLMASEWNLLTEDFADDEEDVLVVSTPVNEEREAENDDSLYLDDQNKKMHLPLPQLGLRPPLISSEDDDTMCNSDSVKATMKASSSASAMANPGYAHLIPYNFRLDSEDYEEEEEEATKEDGGDENENENLDDVEESRRYLTIHSAPLYRWSEGMLPSMAKLQKQDELRLKDKDVHLEDADHDHDLDDDVDNDPEEEKKMLLESVQSK